MKTQHSQGVEYRPSGTIRVTEVQTLLEREAKMQWENLVRHQGTKGLRGQGKGLGLYSPHDRKPLKKFK